jgi:hypothetical protein
LGTEFYSFITRLNLRRRRVRLALSIDINRETLVQILKSAFRCRSPIRVHPARQAT